MDDTPDAAHDQYKDILAATSDPAQRQVLRDLWRERVEALADNATLRNANALLHQNLLDERQEHAEAIRLAQTSLSHDADVTRLRRELERSQNAAQHYKAQAESASTTVRSLSARVEQAEALALDATEKLEHEKREAKQKVDEAHAGRSKASKGRAYALQQLTTKDEELHFLRAELAGKGSAATTLARSGSPNAAPSSAEGMEVRAPPPPPALRSSAEGLGGTNFNSLMASARGSSSTSLQPTSAIPRAEVVDLSLDGEEATSRSGLRIRDGDSSTAPARRSSPRNALTVIMAHSTSNDRASNGIKRSSEQVESREDTSKAAKRTKGPNQVADTDARPRFNYNSTKRLVDAAPASLNQRVADMIPIEPMRIPAHKLPTAANPTTGWVKRTVFTEKYHADGQKMNTKLSTLPSQVLVNAGPEVVYPGTEQAASQPALFARIDMNPGLPTYPGKPGTLITSRTDIPLNQHLLVVVRSMETFWQFVGLYTLRSHERSVTVQEWKGMPQAVRNKWAEQLSSPTNRDPHQRIAIRLALAVRRGGPVADDEVERTFGQYSRGGKAAAEKQRMRPTKDEVLKGFDRGYATLDVITLEPVSICENLYEEIWDRR